MLGQDAALLQSFLLTVQSDNGVRPKPCIHSRRSWPPPPSSYARIVLLDSKRPDNVGEQYGQSGRVDDRENNGGNQWKTLEKLAVSLSVGGIFPRNSLDRTLKD